VNPTGGPRRSPGDDPEVVTLGECLVAFVGAEAASLADAPTLTRHVAGAEANVAVGLVRLGHPSTFIGRVGDDPFGTTIVRRLRGEGVDVAHLPVDPAPTGLLFRDRRSVGPREVAYRRAGSAGSRLAAADVDAAEAVIAAARWLHLSGITPALSDSARAAADRAVELARRHGLTVSLDVNLRRRLWSDADAVEVLRPLAGRVDVVLAGLEEGAVLAGLAPSSGAEEVAVAVAAATGARVVIKLGRAGALALDRDGEVVRRPAIPVPLAVDPVGAGDAFCAGWIAAQLEGMEPAAALDLANACGAAAVGSVGDQEGLPTREEVDRLLGVDAEEVIR